MDVTLMLECKECGVISTSLFNEDIEIIVNFPKLKYIVTAICPQCGSDVAEISSFSEVEAEIINLLPVSVLSNVRMFR